MQRHEGAFVIYSLKTMELLFVNINLCNFCSWFDRISHLDRYGGYNSGNGTDHGGLHLHGLHHGYLFTGSHLLTFLDADLTDVSGKRSADITILGQGLDLLLGKNGSGCSDPLFGLGSKGVDALMMIHVEIDIGFAIMFIDHGRSDFDDVLLAVMIGKGEGCSHVKFTLMQKDGRRQDINLAEFFLELEKVDRIIGVLQIEDQLLLGGFMADSFGSGFCVPARYRCPRSRPCRPSSSRIFCQSAPEDLLVDPVGRLVKGKGSILAKEQVLQVAGGVAVAFAALTLLTAVVQRIWEPGVTLQ